MRMRTNTHELLRFFLSFPRVFLVDVLPRFLLFGTYLVFALLLMALSFRGPGKCAPKIMGSFILFLTNSSRFFLFCR